MARHRHTIAHIGLILLCLCFLSAQEVRGSGGSALRNKFAEGSSLEVDVYITSRQSPSPDERVATLTLDDSLLSYGQVGGQQSFNVTFHQDNWKKAASKRWTIVAVVREAGHSNSATPCSTATHLTSSKPFVFIHPVRNLLFDDPFTPDQVTPPNPAPMVTYLKPHLELTVAFNLPQTLSMTEDSEILQFSTRAGKSFCPTMGFNDIHSEDSKLVSIADHELDEIQVEVTVAGVSFDQLVSKFQSSMALKQMKEQYGLSENDVGEVRGLLLDTDPWLLTLTVVVSFLHIIFESLAFMSDISFWKNRDSVEGLSVNMMIVDLICQIVVLLYLSDNDSGLLILSLVGAGISVDIWKLTKAIKWKISFWHGVVPYPQLESQKGYETTKIYDSKAMCGVALLLGCAIAGYSGYSLVYLKHKGWYSWALASITAVVYALGFLLMLPQLFINYKLKSVSHLPWKKLVYKAINTFIDDLFALIIKMPTMHRISCLRDDVVFLVFLYQRWIYSVDYNRPDTNGGGSITGGEEDEKKKNSQSFNKSEQGDDTKKKVE